MDYCVLRMIRYMPSCLFPKVVKVEMEGRAKQQGKHVAVLSLNTPHLWWFVA